MESLPKAPARERPTQATIIEARQACEKIFNGISNMILNTEHYGYTFIIYTSAQWIALGNALQVVPPTDIGAYGGGDQAERYAYEASKASYAAYKRHKDATVRMIIHIFGEVVFLNLQDIHQNLVDHTPLEFLAYLKRTYVTDTQKRDDITAMDIKMRQPISMDMTIESFSMDMTPAQFILASHNTIIGDAKMIRLCLVQFMKNPEMNEPCENCEDSILARKYSEFQNFMIKQIIQIEGRKGTLATANIANLVKDSTKQATEIILGELLVQAEEICTLRAQIGRNTVYDDVPSLVNTNTLFIMRLTLSRHQLQPQQPQQQ